jgi:tripartite-type tricarboxylate transporter receptor subunit TctC
MMITSIGMATNKQLYSKLHHNPVKDFAPVSLQAVVPDVRARFATIGAEPVGSESDERTVHLARESDRWTLLVVEHGIKLD